MYHELKDKVALITGATKGIGRGIAENNVSLGIKIILNYYSDEKAAKETRHLIESYGVEYLLMKTDVSKPEAIEKLYATAVSHFGKIDIVVANAGVELIEPPVLNSTEAEF